MPLPEHVWTACDASGYVTFWGTDDGTLPVKPDGKLVELAAESWNIKPEELLMVGDTPNDMRFAHNGHAFAIGVLSGTGKDTSYGMRG